jgi:hypothetical protein
LQDGDHEVEGVGWSDELQHNRFWQEGQPVVFGSMDSIAFIAALVMLSTEGDNSRALFDVFMAAPH